MRSLESLVPWNPHWVTGQVSPLILRHPEARAPVQPWIQALFSQDDHHWHVVAGARQIGKTTSLGHVARGLIGQGVLPKRIAFVPMDQPAIQGEVGLDLDGLIAALSEQAAPSPERPLFLLLDEIQDLEPWAQTLKAAWDRHHLTVKTLATGSSAMNLNRPANADFPGRIRTTLMYPMKFREVLFGHGERLKHANEDAWSELDRLCRAARPLMVESSQNQALGEHLTHVHDYIRAVAPGLAAFIGHCFLQYVGWGGYPAARPGTGRKITERREVFEQAWHALLGKDLVAAGIVRTREFGQFFHAIARNTGGKFVAENYSRTLGPKAETLAHWKRILEDAMLIQQLPPLKGNLRPVGGKDKAYLTDPGWFTYFRGTTDVTQLSPTELGMLTEAVMIDHVRRLRFNLTGTTNLPIGYIESPEVDIAASLGTRWLLAEVKFTRQPKGTVTDLEAEDALRLVVTRDHFEIAEDTIFIPAAEFALVC